MTRIYTGTGDNGLTGLCDGSRACKTDIVIETLGILDLLNSKIGICLANYTELPLPVKGTLVRSQSDLFNCGAILARAKLNFSESLVDEMEKNIDFLQEKLPELKKFILPGGNPAAANIFELRALARQAELYVWKSMTSLSRSSQPFKSQPQGKEYLRQLKRIAIYLNRFNDYLFVAARFVNSVTGEVEVTWN